MPTARDSTKNRPQSSPQDSGGTPDWLQALMAMIQQYMSGNGQQNRPFQSSMYDRPPAGYTPPAEQAPPPYRSSMYDRPPASFYGEGADIGAPYAPNAGTRPPPVGPGQGKGLNRVATGGQMPGQAPMAQGPGITPYWGNNPKTTASSSWNPPPAPQQIPVPQLSDIATTYLGEYNRVQAQMDELAAYGDDSMTIMDKDGNDTGFPSAYGKLSARADGLLKGLEGVGTQIANSGDAAAMRRLQQEQQNAQASYQNESIKLQAKAQGIGVDQFAQTHGLNLAQLKQSADQFQSSQDHADRTLGITQKFTGEESQKNRDAQIDLMEKQYGLQSTAAADQRQWQTGERQDTQTFTAGQAQQGRQFTAEQQAAQNKFNSDQAQIERDFKAHQASILSAYEKGQLDETRANREMNNAYNQQKMALDKANSDFNNGMRSKEFGLTSQTAVATNLGNAAKLGEDARQFDTTRQDTQRKSAMDAINDYVKQGYNIGTTPEYTTGGAPGGSISQMMEAFGGPKANPAGYLKPQAPLTQMQPAINQYMGTPQGPAPTPTNPALGAFDEFMKKFQTNYGGGM